MPLTLALMPFLTRTGSDEELSILSPELPSLPFNRKSAIGNASHSCPHAVPHADRIGRGVKYTVPRTPRPATVGGNGTCNSGSRRCPLTTGRSLLNLKVFCATAGETYQDCTPPFPLSPEFILKREESLFLNREMRPILPPASLITSPQSSPATVPR